jgi:chromosome segregation ATPase
MQRNAGFAALWLSLALAAGAAGAQTSREGGDSARLNQQIQQLAADRTRLQAEVEKLKGELKKAKSDLEAAQSQNASLGRRAASAEGNLATVRSQSADTEGALARAREQTNELVARFRETAETLREVEGERTELSRDRQRLTGELKTCMERSVALAGIANEALDRYEQKGVWAALVEKEPVTRLKRTEVQNMVDGYRERIDDLASPAGPAPNPAP